MYIPYRPEKKYVYITPIYTYNIKHRKTIGMSIFTMIKLYH